MENEKTGGLRTKGMKRGGGSSGEWRESEGDMSRENRGEGKGREGGRMESKEKGCELVQGKERKDFGREGRGKEGMTEVKGRRRGHIRGWR